MQRSAGTWLDNINQVAQTCQFFKLKFALSPGLRILNIERINGWLSQNGSNLFLKLHSYFHWCWKVTGSKNSPFAMAINIFCSFFCSWCQVWSDVPKASTVWRVTHCFLSQLPAYHNNEGPQGCSDKRYWNQRLRKVRFGNLSLLMKKKNFRKIIIINNQTVSVFSKPESRTRNI